MSDIADEPRAFTVDEILADSEFHEVDSYPAEYSEDVVIISVADTMLDDEGEIAMRLQMAHDRVEDLVAQKRNLFEQLRKAREALGLITRAARIYGITAPASTVDDTDENYDQLTINTATEAP